MDQATIKTILPLAIIAIVFALRFRNIRRARRFRPERLWVLPAVYTALVGLILFAMPPAPLGWGLFALGLLVGGALGWQRARLMHLDIDPKTRELTIRQSPAAFVLLVAIFLGRRMFLPNTATTASGAGHALPASALPWGWW